MSRRKRTQLALGLIFGGAMIAAAWVQYQEANAKSSEATVLLAAESYLRTLEALRDVYTSEVVNRLPASILKTYDYDDHENAIPLPATLTIALADTLSSSIEGFRVKLYSEYPFPHQERPEMDDFERSAIDSLKVSTSAVVSVIEGAGRDRVLRYARGDTMRAECVTCHNEHPESPKTDWEVGDLRGVLAVSIPMTSFDDRAREARGPYTMLLVLALLGLLGAIVMLLQYFPNLPGQGSSPRDSAAPLDDT